MKLLLLLFAFPMVGFGQNVNIPDANFKKYLINNAAINKNGDREIQVSEASAFNDTIDCSEMEISNLRGIEAFTALTALYCGNNQLTSLDVSKNNALAYLWCSYNQLTNLVSKNTALIELSCEGNQLTIIDLSKNTALTSLVCGFNQLTSLDISKNSALTYLTCEENQLTSLDVSKNNALTELGCYDNKFDCDALKRKYGIKN
jgi:Leucine-rich repeat (LRR) protein